MKTRTLIAALAIALVATPAMAKKSRPRVQPACVDKWERQLSLVEVLFSNRPEPQANGCAPAVYATGRFVGQDPDPRIRYQLRRNSDLEGYHLAKP